MRRPLRPFFLLSTTLMGNGVAALKLDLCNRESDTSYRSRDNGG